MPVSKFNGQLQSKKIIYIEFTWFGARRNSTCLVWCLNNLYKIIHHLITPQKAAAIQPLKLAKFQIFSSTSSPKCHASVSAPHHRLPRFQEESTAAQRNTDISKNRSNLKTIKGIHSIDKATHTHPSDPFLLQYQVPSQPQLPALRITAIITKEPIPGAHGHRGRLGLKS